MDKSGYLSEGGLGKWCQEWEQEIFFFLYNFTPRILKSLNVLHSQSFKRRNMNLGGRKNKQGEKQSSNQKLTASS